MSSPIDNNISVKEYKIIENKNIEIEIEYARHLKTTTVSVIMVVLGIIKKMKDKHIWNTKKCSLQICSSL